MTAIVTISSSRITMRALDRWSDSSFIITVPSPCQGEPSRRMTNSFTSLGLALEKPSVDRVEAGLVDGEPRQRRIGGNHHARGVGAHITGRIETIAIGTGALNGG